jgi:NADH dehydrogenase
LLEAQDKILPYVAHAQRNAVEKRLTNLGIEIVVGAKINEVMATCVVLTSGAKCEADIILWGGGTRGPEIFKSLSGIKPNKDGKLAVNKFLQTSENVFAIGDNAAFIDVESGNPAPATAFIAEQQADIAAKNILLSIKGLPLTEYKLAIPGYVISCGGKYAVVSIYGVTFSGFLGWALKRLIDLKYFTSILPLYKALSLWFKEMSLFSKND